MGFLETYNAVKDDPSKGEKNFMLLSNHNLMGVLKQIWEKIFNLFLTLHLV